MIGLIQASGGVSVMIFQLLLVPKANNKFGLLNTMRVALIVCIPVFFVVPFFNKAYGGGLYTGIVICYVMFAAVQASVLTLIGIAINNSVVSSILGAANGFA